MHTIYFGSPITIVIIAIKFIRIVHSNISAKIKIILLALVQTTAIRNWVLILVAIINFSSTLIASLDEVVNSLPYIIRG